MIFDAHGDILSDVMEHLEKNEDIWNTYHKPMYNYAQVKTTVLINFSDPFSSNQKEYFEKVNQLSVPYFKNHSDINIVNNNNFTKDKMNVILGIEGLNALDNMADIERMYSLGYRLYGITWNEKNKFASSHQEMGGLTPLGVDLVKYLDENNCIIDLAHASRETFFDVKKLTKNPLIVSHSAIDSIHETTRNLTDEQLYAISETNGVVGIYNIRHYLSDSPDTVSMKTFVDHIDYVVNLIGIDYIGLGLDFCYYLGSATQSETIDFGTLMDIGNLYEELESRNYSSEDIRKITHDNFMRVTKEIFKN